LLSKGSIFTFTQPTATVPIAVRRSPQMAAKKIPRARGWPINGPITRR
jgi:hypothetical protein